MSHSSASTRATSGRRWVWLTVAAALSVAILLLFNIVPFLRGGFGWRWPYIAPHAAQVGPAAWAAVGLALYGFGHWRLRRATGRRRVLWAFLGALALPLLLLRLQHPDVMATLFARTVSTVAGGAHHAALLFDDTGALLREWPAALQDGRFEYARHMATSPPGLAAAYRLAADGAARLPGAAASLAGWVRPLQCDDAALMAAGSAELAAAWLGILSPLWGALTVWPLAGIGRRLGAPAAGVLAAAAWPLVPALTQFSGTLNTPFPWLTTAMVAALVAGQPAAGRRHAWLIIAGAITGLCVLLNFALVPIGLLGGLTIIFLARRHGGAWRARAAWGRLLAAEAAYGAGVALVWAAHAILAGHTMVDILTPALANHFDLTRPYWPWLWLHAWDVALFAGLPLVAAALAYVARGRAAPLWPVVGATVAALAILLVSGTARGETGRVWMMFMPLLLLGAAGAWRTAARPARAALLAAQLVWLAVMVTTTATVGTELVPPPAYAAVRPTIPTGAAPQPVNARFGDDLILEAFAAVYDPAAGAVDLFLTWRPLRPLPTSYLFNAIAVAPDGGVQGGTTWLPLDYRYPTTCWHASISGAPLIDDRVVIPAAPGVTDGAWWISLSVFTTDAAGAPRYLPVTSADGARDPQQLGLGPIAGGGGS